jgi:hypothetical protein
VRFIVAAILFVAGCGGCDGDPGTIDGDGTGDGDGMVDADIDADPNVRGMVTVHLVDKLGNSVPGIDVIFIDTDATQTRAVTDATGTVQASVYPNASVTAVHEHTGANSYSLTTLLALDPGDDITLVTSWENAQITEDPFSVRVMSLPSADLASASKSGSTGTFTTIQPHGLAVGDTVIISDTSPSGYNGSWPVTSVTATGFTATLPSGGLGAGTTLGNAAKGTPYTVTFTAYAGAQSYVVYTSCGGTNVGTTLNPTLVLHAGCVKSPTHIAVVAIGAGPSPIAYAKNLDVTIAANGNHTINDTWHSMASVSSTFSNATNRVLSFSTERYEPYLRIAAVGSGGASTGGPVTVYPQSMASPLAFMKTRLECPAGQSADCISNNVGTAIQTITERVDGTAATYSLDIGANLLPWVSGEYKPQTTSIDVTVTGSGAIDLFEANLRYTGATTTARNGYIYNWRVFGPLAQSITFPTLPSDLPGDPTVQTTDVQSQYQLWACETDGVSGYRDAIKNPYQALAICEANPSLTTKPLTATKSRVSRWN